MFAFKSESIVVDAASEANMTDQHPLPPLHQYFYGEIKTIIIVVIVIITTLLWDMKIVCCCFFH